MIKTVKNPNSSQKLCCHGSYNLVGERLIISQNKKSRDRWSCAGGYRQRFNTVFKNTYSFHLFILLSSACILCPQPCNLIAAGWLPQLQASHCRHISLVKEQGLFPPLQLFYFSLEGKLSQKCTDFKFHFLESYHIPDKITGKV